MNLQARQITIGRKPGNTIVLHNSDVSGTHAKLTLIGALTDTWEIQDMGSANGTFVDGIRVVRKEVTPRSQIKLGQTVVSWELITGKKQKSTLPLENKADPSESVLPAADEALRNSATSLKKVSDTYREKKDRMAEIQAQEAINSRVQGLGFPMGALIGSMAQALPAEYRILGYAGGIISLGFAVNALISSKKLSKERKVFSGFDDWFKIHYVCPHCHTFIQQPFEILEKTKHCKACKKALIP